MEKSGEEHGGYHCDRRRACRHRGRAGCFPHGDGNGAVYDAHRHDRLYAVQSQCRRTGERYRRAGDRCVRRRDGPGGGRDRAAVQDAQHDQRARRAEPARAKRQDRLSEIHAGCPAASGTSAGEGTVRGAGHRVRWQGEGRAATGWACGNVPCADHHQRDLHELYYPGGPSRSVRGTGGGTDHGRALAEPARSGDPCLPLEDWYAGSGEERFDRFHEDCGAAWHR